jgi:transcriptional regulator with GAF, ATPase, and Fis domain
VFDLVIQAAPSRSTVLVNGESGTGKELVARALHNNSLRAEKPFVTVNSGNLPPDLLESNLFGHVKGAFTGAVAPKKGLFEVADKGSIFFDEIGNIPLETQAKLLRVIQEREFMRLGGVETIKVDVRIIAATNVDLRTMVDDGRFREDLYYRLHVITVNLPPLRSRKEDVPLLVQHFLEKYGEENNRRELELAPEALDLLLEYDWPGNVRELENVIERLLVTAPGDTVTVRDLPLELQAPRNLSLRPKHERRRTVADDLYKKLTEDHESFWTAVYPLYMQREITRGHMRDLVRKGLENARGNYKIVAKLFNMEQRDYKRFLNFLRKHDCQLPFQEYRQ